MFTKKKKKWKENERLTCWVYIESYVFPKIVNVLYMCNLYKHTQHITCLSKTLLKFCSIRQNQYSDTNTLGEMKELLSLMGVLCRHKYVHFFLCLCLFAFWDIWFDDSYVCVCLCVCGLILSYSHSMFIFYYFFVLYASSNSYEFIRFLVQLVVSFHFLHLFYYFSFPHPIETIILDLCYRKMHSNRFWIV